MPRAKRGFKARRRRKGFIKAAKGFRGRRHNCYRAARQEGARNERGPRR